MKKRIAPALAVVVVVAGLATTTEAQADDNVYTGESYCGTPYSGDSPAESAPNAFNDMTNDFYDSLLENAGGPTSLCDAYHELINRGASAIVPGPVKQFIRGYRAANGMEGSAKAVGPQPTQLPEAGHTASNTYPVAWTGGQGLWLVDGPSLSSNTLMLMPDGTNVRVLCQREGDAVSNGAATTTLWDRVEVVGSDGRSMTGYASDAFINTGADGAVASTCS